MVQGPTYVAYDSYGFKEPFPTHAQAVDSLHARHKFTIRHLRLLQAGESVSRGNLHAWVEQELRGAERIPRRAEEASVQLWNDHWLRLYEQHIAPDSFNIFYRGGNPCTIEPISSPVEDESSSSETPLNPSET